MASAANTSISNHNRYRFSSVQMAVITSREYRGIITSPRLNPFFRNKYRPTRRHTTHILSDALFRREKPPFHPVELKLLIEPTPSHDRKFHPPCERCSPTPCRPPRSPLHERAS